MADQRRAAEALERVREICLGLPEVSERLSHGSPAWFVRGKKTVAMFVDDHHGDGILGIWCPAFPGVQAEMVEAEPERFFRPPYVGPSGWLGVRLDRDVSWDEVASIVTDSFRKVAPKTLVAKLDATGDAG
ncbi:MmcQ/YjbR family DNA-binding protein [Desertimonas flava]|jgi:hypothetical protein|uniref:MmcQ/YjbR family DNA-binding protein n=1 Tax=Desertimonas flava TaxID=2064846 RepID=UPI000E35226D|nr:MmcQ/YjbR family DNA-binding protein [Desertimonas flava]